MKKVLFIIFLLYININIHAFWTDADGVGQESINISLSLGNSHWALIVTDVFNNPHVVWRDQTSGNNAYYLKWNGSEWVDVDGSGRESINVSNTNNVGTGPQIRLDNNNIPCISWGQSNGSYFQKWNGTNWVGMDGTVAGIRHYTSVITGGFFALEPLTNYPHKVWDGIYYTNWNGSIWSNPISISGGSGGVIQIDALGIKHLINTNGGSLYYSWYNGSDWVGANGGTTTADKLVVSSIVNWSVYLEVDSFGKPHIVYEKNGDVYYLKWDGVAWVDADGVGTESSNISNNSGTSSRPRLALDPLGRPGIVWSDNTDGNYDIYFLRWNGSQWVDADGIGQESKKITTTASPSIEAWVSISNDDTVHVVWQEQITGNSEIYYLKYISDTVFTPTSTFTATETITVTLTYIATSTYTTTVTSTPTITPTYDFSGVPIIYPNPFNPEKTTMKFLNMPIESKIEIFTVSLENVISLSVNNPFTIWEGKNRKNCPVSPGIYYYIVTKDKNVIFKGKLFVIRQ